MALYWKAATEDVWLGVDTVVELLSDLSRLALLILLLLLPPSNAELWIDCASCDAADGNLQLL